MAELIWRLRLRARMLRFALTAYPIAGAAEDVEPEPEPAEPEEGGGDAEPAEKPGPVDDKDRKTWETEARKHEKRAKAEARRVAALEKELASRDEAAKSEQEKAIDAAKAEARNEAKAEADKVIRKERLDSAVARLAAGRFADVDDALALVTIDADEIFDEENTVDTTALRSALDDLLEKKPHLAAKPGRPVGDADGGKGAGGKRDPSEMTPAEHLAELQKK